MSPARRPTHHGQLLASAVALCSLTAALIWSARASDTDAARWFPVAGACVVLWFYSLIWAVMAVAFTIADWIADAKAPPRTNRPAPGEGLRAESWSFAELRAADDAWLRDRRDADEWAAEDVDVLAEARHAAGRAA